VITNLFTYHLFGQTHALSIKRRKSISNIRKIRDDELMPPPPLQNGDGPGGGGDPAYTDQITKIVNRLADARVPMLGKHPLLGQRKKLTPSRVSY